ncbi:MAG TPA: exonuclease SbcCD subunit D [Desulfotomaculum sp.]|nr:MAG: exonuclease SbcD [Desulfotomaculum sp. BICA1-6]HBX22611.1 exonuclease SbcCD subunit D [Desulfotomaculum sp.]
MRFLHTSDWHLGRIFHGVHLTDDQAHVLDQFIELVKDVKPDAVLIAGDVYDRSVPPIEAVRLLDETITRILLDCRVPVIMIAGNHDSPERLGFGTRLLARQGLHVVSRINGNPAPVILGDAYGPVYFCPVPYAEPPVVRQILSVTDALDHDRALRLLTGQLLAQIPAGARSVALAHAFVAGGEASDSERPLSVGGTGAVDCSCFHNFHYTALGHLHSPQRAGSTAIRYAGSLLKYSFAESANRKSVTLVEMDGAGEVQIEEMALTPRRDVCCLSGYLDELITMTLTGDSPNRDDYLMVTLKDTGAILDAIGKLRAVYPNVLHIERPCLAGTSELRGPGGDHRRVNEADLFASFFEQVTGEHLQDDLQQTFAETLESLYRQEREAQV